MVQSQVALSLEGVIVSMPVARKSSLLRGSMLEMEKVAWFSSGKVDFIFWLCRAGLCME
jgi:hypothetical protein